MLKTFTLLFALCFGTLLVAQTATVQVIHNSPTVGTDSGPTVDVYAGTTLLLDDVAYRTASSYLTVPAGMMIELGVAPANSTASTDAFYSLPVGPLEADEEYVVYANGAVDDADQPFALVVSDQASTTAPGAGLVDLLAFHGALDAPGVDIKSGVLTIVDDLLYGTFADPDPVPATSYTLTVTTADGMTTINDYTVDISALGGQGINVFASGVLNDTPDFGFFAALPDGTVVELPAVMAPPAATANLQVIHNSPTTGTDSGPTVDVYAGGVLLLDDFEYLTATPYISVPAGVGIPIAVAPADSDSADDAIYTTTLGPLDADTDYVAYATGEVGNTDQPFEIAASGNADQTATNASDIDLLVYHGALDAPTIDISIGSFTLVSELSYGEFDDVDSIPALDFDLRVVVSDDNSTVATFIGDLTPFADLGVNVFATGVAGDTPEFGLAIAGPDGTVVQLQRAEAAVVQVVHASPTPGTADGPAVDVYVNGSLFGFFTDIPYLGATGLITIPTTGGSGTYTFAVAPAGTTIDDAIFTTDVTFDTDEQYVIYATGIVGDADNPFMLSVDSAVVLQNSGVDDEIVLNVFHASPGAPAVDVYARDVMDALVANLEFAADGQTITVAPGNYVLETTPAGSTSVVASNFAGLAGVGGSTFHIFAGGILGGEPPFRLYAVNTGGDVFELSALAQVQVIHNAPSPSVDVYQDDELILEDVAFRTATGYLDFFSSEDFTLSVAPAGSDSVDDAIFTTGTLNLEDYTNVQIMAYGIVGDADRPFGLAVLTDARQGSDDAANVDLIAFHGGVDAPTVDVVVNDNGSVLFDDLEYGTYADDYVSVAAASYVLNVTPADDNDNIVASFIADLSDLGGGAATVFASGYLNPGTDQPGFGLYATLPDGTTFPLEVTTGTTELAEGVGAFTVFPTVASAEVSVDFALDRAATTQLLVVNAAGAVVQTQRFGQLTGEQRTTLDVSALAAGQHYVLLRTGDRVTVRAISVQR